MSSSSSSKKRGLEEMMQSYHKIRSVEQYSQEHPELYGKLLKERLEILDRRNSEPEYRTFKELKEAKNYNSEKYASTMPIFACNYKNSNSTYFILTSYEVLWNKLKLLPKCDWNCYEQIRPMDPCHGYLDIEIHREANKERPRAELESDIHLRMMEEIQEFAKELGYLKEEEDRRIVFEVTEASNEKKISLHITMIVPNRRFKNNYHFGCFVRSLCRKLVKKYGEPSKNPFFFKNAQGAWVFWADMAVFTCNRNFRMTYQTKTNGYRPLLPIKIIQGGIREQREEEKEFDRAIWKKTLIQAMTREEIESKTFAHLRCNDPITNEEPYSTNDTKYFLGVSTIKKGDPPPHPQSHLVKRQKVPEQAHQQNLCRLLIEIIRSFWKSKDPSPSLPSFHYFNEKTSTMYFSSRSHFCTFRNGYHKTEHVKFRVDLARAQLSQQCWSQDQSCYRMSSEPWDLLSLSTTDKEELLKELKPYLRGEYNREEDDDDEKQQSSFSSDLKQMIEFGRGRCKKILV